jgi:serine/threonine protein kinase
MSHDDSAFDSIFDRARSIASPQERAAFLARACGEDVALRQRVEKLVAAHFAAGSFLEEPVSPSDALTAGVAPGEAPMTSEAGDRIGPYRLVQKLGEGGMGAVWVAEQSEPKRRVALKLIKPGMDSAQVLRRFEAERQALALMEHDNVAKVFDGGTTEQGRPYFVMELVKGVPITKYCDELHLPIEERLELFIPVCRAIQHAHQRGIIHRDVKPSNVLVAIQDGKPVPKVIDFGVAKALHRKLTDESMYTEVGQLVGTLEYVSPEQAELSALDVDTRTDVYALGALLYELLTGSTPLDRERLRSAAIGEVLRIIREEEPAKPSTRLTDSKELLAGLATQRRADPARLVKQVRGELDWVVMRCLEKDRTRRYESASALARDVERHLKDEPVEACPPSAGYRLGKFARKHRAALTTAAAFVLLLVTAAVLSSTLAFQAKAAEARARSAQEDAEEKAGRAAEAEKLASARLKEVTTQKDRSERAEKTAAQEAALARAISDYLRLDLLALADPQQQGRKDLQLREVLDRAAASVGSRLDKQPVAEAAVRHLIGDAYLGLGEYKLAQEHLERARDLRRKELGDEHPDTLRTLARLGDLYAHLGLMPQSQQTLETALATARRVLGDEHPVTLECRHRLGMALLEDGDWKKAEEHLGEAVAGYGRSLGEEHPDTLDVLGYLTCLEIYQGKYDDAQKHCRKGLDAASRIAPDRQKYLEGHFLFRRAMLRAAQAQTSKNRNDVLESYAAADNDFDKAHKLWSGIFGSDHYYPTNVKLHQALAWHDEGRVDREKNWDGRERAGAQLKECLEAYRKKLPAGHPTIAFTRAWYADNLLARGKWDEAEAEAKEMLASAKQRTADAPHAIAAYVLGASQVGRKRYDAEPERRLVAAFEALRNNKLASNQGYVLAEICKALAMLHDGRHGNLRKDRSPEATKWSQEQKKHGPGRYKVIVGGGK